MDARMGQSFCLEKEDGRGVFHPDGGAELEVRAGGKGPWGLEVEMPCWNYMDERSSHGDAAETNAGSIPGLAQWVKDLALP